MTALAASMAPDVRRAGLLTVTLMALGVVAGLLLAVAVGDVPAELIGLTPRTDSSVVHAGDVFVNNTRVVFAVMLAAGTAAAAREALDSSQTRRARILPAAFRTACDVVVALIVLLNVALVAVALSAFGALVLRALWLHGPIETFGFCVALSLYLAARRGQLTTRRALTVAPLSIGVLAVAALLETNPVF